MFNKLNNLKLSNKFKLVSFDIVKLYSNNPITETINLLQHLLSNNFTDNETKSIINLISHVINNNFCSFNNKFYKINDGLPMGMPLSGILAEILLNHFESNFIINNHNPFNNYSH